MSSTSELEQVLLDLESVSAIKFGDFLLKSGLRSPVYFDLRVIVAHPRLMARVSKLLWSSRSPSSRPDLLCGVPYTALPLATLISAQEAQLPMCMRRKEKKGYGTAKMIEGQFERGDNCLIVEDVVTSGSSVLETARDLEEEGLKVTDAVVLLDREQGGAEMLAKKGISLRSVCGMSHLMEVLCRHARVTEATREAVLQFIKNNQISGVKDALEIPAPDPSRMSLEDRASAEGTNLLSARLLRLMIRKRSNLCVALDGLGDDAPLLLRLAAAVGPHVCCIKTHADSFSPGKWTGEEEAELRRLAEKHDFLLFEDRKLSDIGSTVAAQYSRGAGRWSHLVTAHGVAGEGVLRGIHKAIQEGGEEEKEQRGVLLVAQMSCEGNLITSDYSRRCAEMCASFPSLVVGLVSQSRLPPASGRPGCLHFTPGVSASSSGDGLGQRYVGPEEAVAERGADVVIVGRGVVGDREEGGVAKRAEEYRARAWDALQKRISGGGNNV